MWRHAGFLVAVGDHIDAHRDRQMIAVGLPERLEVVLLDQIGVNRRHLRSELFADETLLDGVVGRREDVVDGVAETLGFEPGVDHGAEFKPLCKAERR